MFSILKLQSAVIFLIHLLHICLSYSISLFPLSCLRFSSLTLPLASFIQPPIPSVSFCPPSQRPPLGVTVPPPLSPGCLLLKGRGVKCGASSPCVLRWSGTRRSQGMSWDTFRGQV
ncbi:hypothetical protein E2C01_068937 [Portunus trituberculatus]|uniref:Uncharacterized protein n=1 Tax=Portunus trituberculatus TaxID=210409 RepID=A0A5B7I1H3_PORTR|nr:hypothetical protein [Portunus trituberculatus]